MEHSGSIVRVSRLSTSSSSDSILFIGEDQDSKSRVHIHRPVLKKLVGNFRELVKTFDPKSDPSLQLSGQNFLMGWVGSKGARLAFPDESVVMDIPPGAFTHPQAVYCCRIDDIDSRSSSASAEVVFYSTILALGATDKKFNRKVHIKFRHFAQFDNDEQKSALAAFAQYDLGCRFEKEPTFEIHVDDEFIILKVDHFCNLGAGVDANDQTTRPPKRLALISFLVFADFSKDVAATLNIIVADDDPSHLSGLRNRVAARRWYNAMTSDQSVRICDVFPKLICDVRTDLNFKFIPSHFNVEETTKVVSIRTTPASLKNNLKRDAASGFNEEAILCSVEVTGNPTIPLLNFDVCWEDHCYCNVVQVDEIVAQRREEHAASNEGAVGGEPREVSVMYEFGANNRLDVSELQPSRQESLGQEPDA